MAQTIPLLKNRYKGPMDMDNRVGIDCERRGRGGGESNGGKIETTVIEQKQNKN